MQDQAPFVVPEQSDEIITLWIEMDQLQAKYNCLSFGQGMPNGSPPEFLMQAMNTAMREGHNQYDRGMGVMPLVTNIAKKYGPTLGREIDPLKEVLVTLGANGSLASFIKAWTTANDQVLIFEPMFPMYIAHAEISGGKFQGFPLTLDENHVWQFDPVQLRAELSKPETKVFLINTPHNPTGKVFTAAEIQVISDILDDCPHVKVISDEVYEFLTYDGRQHTPFATVGNNWKRTVSVYSGGKLMNATGWKIGWSVGPSNLICDGARVALAVYDSFNTPGQMAMGNSLEQCTVPNYNEARDSFVQTSAKMFVENRDSLAQAITNSEIPWKPVLCQGGYFLMADVSECRDLIPEQYLLSHDYETEDGSPPVKKARYNMPNGKVPLDLAFCRWMAIEKSVIMLPGSFFYHENSATITDQYVRLSICKDRVSTENAIERLRNC